MCDFMDAPDKGLDNYFVRKLYIIHLKKAESLGAVSTRNFGYQIAIEMWLPTYPSEAF